MPSAVPMKLVKNIVSMRNGHAKTSCSLDDLDETQQHVLQQHAREISAQSRLPSDFYSHTRIGIARKRAHKLRALLHFLRHSASKYSFAILTSPQTVAADPFGASFALIVLPIIHFALLSIETIFLVSGWFGVQKLGNWFSEEFGSGLSAVNMLEPTIFDNETVEAILNLARKSLVNPLGIPISQSTRTGDDEDTMSTRYFNLDIAKAFIIFCSLIYERDDKYVKEAAKISKREDINEVERQRQVANLIVEGSRHIITQAASWGLNFSSVTDFTSIGGPFCGLFWPKATSTQADDRWIVIVFKGTSPTNFSEFLVDATINHHDGQTFFGKGAVHQGFYMSLAPGMESQADPYGSILRSLKHVARRMRNGQGDKVNLWITGHSLGSAIASLLYARLLFAPEDLGEDLVLRQGYMYGTPRVVDANFISAFEFASSTPFGDTSKSLWRVIDRWDIVTHVPPGLADHEENRAVLPKTSLLNYGHFGTAGIRLTGISLHHPSALEIIKGSLRAGSSVCVVESKKTEPIPPPMRRRPKLVEVFGLGIDLIALLRLVVSWGGPATDHIPYNYYKRLNQVKPDLTI